MMRMNNNNNSRYDYEEEAAAASGSGCFRFFCFDGRRWNRLQGGEHKEEGEEESWFVKKMKEVKEFSEVVAGPKWKNFIRKLGKYSNTKKSRMAECRQYDPQSYALNFDDGAVADFEEQDDDTSLLVRGFSSKSPPPPVSASL